MENILLTTWLITTFLAITSLSILLSSLMLDEPETRNKKFYHICFASFLFFLIATYTSGAKWDTLSDKRIADEKTAATYYEVTTETIEQISTFCEEEHIKLSTQNACNSSTKYNLKLGEPSNGFNPSTTVVKPSGISPQ